jgi:hypothetical protein
MGLCLRIAGGRVSKAAPLGSDATLSASACKRLGRMVRAAALFRRLPVKSLPARRSATATANAVSADSNGAYSARPGWRRRARQHQFQVDAKSANHGGNSNRPELIGCSMKPHRCDARPTSALMLMW